MQPASVSLKIYQGATFRRKLKWLTGNPQAPVNLTGYVGRMMIRRRVGDVTPEVELTTSNGGIVVTNAANGEFEIRMTATQTAGIDISSGVYDLEWAIGSEVIRFMSGYVSISPEVTR